MLYDIQGRPALSTLSAPINNTGSFTYKSDFIKDSGNSTYNNADFETGAPKALLQWVQQQIP